MVAGGEGSYALGLCSMWKLGTSELKKKSVRALVGGFFRDLMGFTSGLSYRLWQLAFSVSPEYLHLNA